MKPILFFDFEIDSNAGKIKDIGCVSGDNRSYHGASVEKFISILNRFSFICGHNIIDHDFKYILNERPPIKSGKFFLIDTLYLSPLLFPQKPYHKLVKDDKLLSDSLNNPLNDSKNARELFYDELNKFNSLAEAEKQIYRELLKNSKYFTGFFKFQNSDGIHTEKLPQNIKNLLSDEICSNAQIERFIADKPVELAYAIALILTRDRDSVTPPWLLKRFPAVETIIHKLRNTPCLEGCNFCLKNLDPFRGLKKYFGFENFRKFEGEPLQQRAVEAALFNKSLLVIFPTGGGKSLTFQLPALMTGDNNRGLTVVISPLQSLMKDQVDKLEESNITEAVTINGMLDPIERSKAFERVENGSAKILYISPESLRSKTIERLLFGRFINRFVIDEAHCFSTWGHDFRVDYLYIADFIANLQKFKDGNKQIPVSCFTATAQQNVIADIQRYFSEKLDISLELFKTDESRKNLTYEVFENPGEEKKYQELRRLLESKKCASIIYVSRTQRAKKIADRLSQDGFSAAPYHGKMDIREKNKNQERFTSGELDIIVATSAFGMGVDKKDVGMVIHFDISDSLENYVQEAGRAGRDQNISAECFILFDEEDLNKHFILLNQTKISISEIQQIWTAVKRLSKKHSVITASPLEIAREAGWNDTVVDIETRVKTSLSALEIAGLLKRKQNVPRIYASSIQCKTANEAIEKINNSSLFTQKQKEQAHRIIVKLIAGKSRISKENEIAESRVDYISDHLGIVKEEVINVIRLMRQAKILADSMDMTAYIEKSKQMQALISHSGQMCRLSSDLLTLFNINDDTYNLKELNESLNELGNTHSSPRKIRTILNFWKVRNWIKIQYQDNISHHLRIIFNEETVELKKKIDKLNSITGAIINYLYDRKRMQHDTGDDEQIRIEFSIIELLKIINESSLLFENPINIQDVENSLFFLSKIRGINIESGFLVVYNRLTIERIEKNNRILYKQDDYKPLENFYKARTQKIHIVGEYAKRMVEDYDAALKFVHDYFNLDYSSFLRRYFRNQSEILDKPITQSKYYEILGELSEQQKEIINDKESETIVVAAGPGSGKTKLLVSKIASLLLLEDIKHEQLLMLTFSRAAASEFKKRMLKLIGNAAHYIEIKTFHSWCFDITGQVGTIEKSDQIITDTINKLDRNEIERCRVTKSVIVIDEAQDLNEAEYRLIEKICEINDGIRLIAVGDDDQNIFEFRGANSKYMRMLLKRNNSRKYELTRNYRGCENLVHFSNVFIKRVDKRLKTNDLKSYKRGNGRIKIFKYSQNNLIVPLVGEVSSSALYGSVCIMTHSNEEALIIYGLLRKEEIPAKLNQAGKEFHLANLLEVRFLLYKINKESEGPKIPNEKWAEIKAEMKTQFAQSGNLDLILNIMKEFEDTHKTRYKTDLQYFLEESETRDFTKNDTGTILISTIHKAKGKEFDNVFLMLRDDYAITEEKIREIFVAITRAKKNLFIFTNSSVMDNITAENLEREFDNNIYDEPVVLYMSLGYEDLNLGYFDLVQDPIKELHAGEPLTVKTDYCLNSKREKILRFSKKFQKTIEEKRSKGYEITSAFIKFIVLWKNKEMENEIRIILPELTFTKKTT